MRRGGFTIEHGYTLFGWNSMDDRRRNRLDIPRYGCKYGTTYRKVFLPRAS